MEKKRVRVHQDLEVYRVAFGEAMRIFEATKAFPKEEVYALTDQIRRSSRSVCANIAEAWRKRRYSAAFVSKLNDAEAEAAETQTWVAFAVGCGYLDEAVGKAFCEAYDGVLGMLVRMATRPEAWRV